MTGHRKTEVAVFGGGCFWCTEAVFEELRGVVSLVPGYAGGSTSHPSYEDISTGKTGHAEVVRIEFDPAEIGYRDLLTVFFATHDPTTRNRQGGDVGTQYRSIILYANEEQKRQAEQALKTIEGAVTEVRPLEAFYEAEEYHREYYRNNASAPYCQATINPKLEKFRKKFAALLKSHGAPHEKG